MCEPTPYCPYVKGKENDYIQSYKARFYDLHVLQKEAFCFW